MERENVYLFSLATLFFASTIFLATVKEVRLDVYFSAFAIWYLICTLAFRPRGRKHHDLVGLAVLLIWSITIVFGFIQQV